MWLDGAQETPATRSYGRAKARIVMHGFEWARDSITNDGNGFTAAETEAPFRTGRALLIINYAADTSIYLAGVSVVTIPEGPAFSFFSFFVAMVLSTQSSAVFRSALRASGSSQTKSARSRYIRLRYAMASS